MAQTDKTVTIDIPEDPQSVWLVTGSRAIRLDAGDFIAGVNLLSEREFEIVKTLLELARNRVASAAHQRRTTRSSSPGGVGTNRSSSENSS